MMIVLGQAQLARAANNNSTSTNSNAVESTDVQSNNNNNDNDVKLCIPTRKGVEVDVPPIVLTIGFIAVCYLIAYIVRYLFDLAYRAFDKFDRLLFTDSSAIPVSGSLGQQKLVANIKFNELITSTMAAIVTIYIVHVCRWAAWKCFS